MNELKFENSIQTKLEINEEQKGRNDLDETTDCRPL